ncbi:hypothetical protein TNIN_370911 [Trichonephila inaurata madagascariensis]|uniref:Uncharacterized protein n=1 Tax=Trichonephila inaurata madagascariensis TaxID=2747483 RepID=A0A8X6MI63_9ARAC|nr:hypothetical protein TNIN_370911 [Trichonephila inaurata madagascariensis]
MLPTQDEPGLEQVELGRGKMMAPTNPSDNHSILQVAVGGPVCKITSSRHLTETSLRSQHPLRLNARTSILVTGDNVMECLNV